MFLSAQRPKVFVPLKVEAPPSTRSYRRTPAPPRKPPLQPSTLNFEIDDDEVEDMKDDPPLEQVLREYTERKGAFAPHSIDERWPYSFDNGDLVWVAYRKKEWFLGKVLMGREKTVDGEEFTYYLVEFRKSLRAWFAPLLGQIKPDTEYTRKLLRGADIIAEFT
ncbi:hypothetical protein JAAARDRAFT_51689 [Jaapia argillacea MUCL 33604]|uniref:Uncharacterized protein n=1 Tax=Jaapia argillacea MUCL 33604 TaxID=933084 RepID=A0A067PGG4_9AGAM|nr:hypothetical protein JAAARDRAFT_51689 [Jaapia argillacea MUCL 33604]